MAESGEPPGGLSTVKRALLAVTRLQAKVASLEEAATAPIAVVGLACRFPGGADTPERFWDLLAAGVDAVTDVPPERWDVEAYYSPEPDAPGKTYSRHGGFLRDVDRFDSWFFRISPREARSLDPQQRLLLEVSWEALERAGLAADRLAGTPAGVFLGMTTTDYAALQMQQGGAASLDGHFFTGNPANTAAGRLAYTYGFEGPAITCDTACSSSLVAIHQACASLRAGECSLALAGGVNLVLLAETTVAVSRTRALAADGRCKTFDRRADGFVRSEGCGLLVLKRLSDAVADGDRIVALIRGSAVNHDGATSGFTVPSGRAQQAVIRRALGTTAPAAIDYLEAHGTGTALGDPIEVAAAAAALGEGRDPSRPLLIGSVKTNIGHAEAAAGIAGVIKVVLALQHETLPPHLHFNEPSPLIPWESLPVRVTSTTTPWPRTGTPRLAGVSAFGASGTNAHVIVEEAPLLPAAVASPPRAQYLLPLSAKTPAALAALARAYRDRLGAEAGVDLGAVARAAAVGRVHHRYRAAVLASSAEEARASLDALGAPRATVSDAPSVPRLAFLFTGQGSQYAGMARSLYEQQPAFARALDACAALLAPRLERPLFDVLWHDRSGLIDRTRFTQPALFAVEYALARLLESWGIRPSAVLGHSVGEYVAATIAGALTLEDGLALIDTRARLMDALPEGGAMAAVLAGEAAVGAGIADAGHAADVAVAAVNAPASTVISGPREAVKAVVSHLSAAGVRSVPLTVSHAFHSPLMDPMLDALEAAARDHVARTPEVGVVSNLTGTFMPGPPDAAYWRAHCRGGVRFAAGIDALVEDGCTIFVEVGPRPTLTALGRQGHPEAGLTWLHTLTPGGGGDQPLFATLAALYECGVAIDWAGVYEGVPRSHAALPTYPFQRERAWIAESTNAMNPHMTPAPPAPARTPRRDEILGLLRTQIARLLQAAESDVNTGLPFLEMGADSIVMVEAIAIIEKEFGLKLAIRRFFEDLPTLDSLASYIDDTLPASDSAPTTSAVELQRSTPTAPVPPPILTPSSIEPGASGTVERVLLEQNRLMAQFLAQQAELLRGLHGGSTAQVTREVQPAASVSPAAASSGAAAGAAAPTRPVMPWGTAAEIRARGLSDTQRVHLEALIERYTKRTPLSKAQAQAFRRPLADSRASVGFRLSTKEMLYPITGARAAGSRMWDIDDNEYIDFTMGFGVHLLGHRPACVQEALRAELERSVELGARSDLAGEVATLFTELTGLERVAFTNSGTEAVMAAVRLARAHTGRDRIAVFTNSYHGHADTTLARAGHGDGPLASVPMVGGVPVRLAEDVLVLDYGSDEALELLRRHGHELAAVLVEPVQSRHPRLQPRAFLHELRSLTHESGTALIFDEMITGFRAHLGGAQAWFGVRADLATYGKIVGGGQPIGLVAGSADFMDGIDGGWWEYGDGSFPAADRTAFGGTFCQHPLSMAAARAVLRHLKAEGPGLQERLNARTSDLVETLNGFFQAEDVPIQATHFSSLFRLEFSSNLDLLFYHLLEKGLYIWEWRSCFVSTAHSDADIQHMIDSVQEGVEALRSGGFIPPPRGGQAASRTMPLSEAQQQIWMLPQIEQTSSVAYNVNTTVALDGPLDETALQTALQRVVDRHTALRTTIARDGTSQRVRPSERVALPLVDFSEVPAPERDAAVERWRIDESGQPIDLVHGPIFRPQLLRLAPDRHVFVLTVHHIVADGTTVGVVLRDLAAFYNEVRTGTPAMLPAPMQYGEYLAQVEARRASPEMTAHAEYWRARFADGVPPLDLPLDRVRPAVKTYHGARVHLRLDAARLASLKQLAREQGCTLHMVLLAAFSLLLHRYCRQDDIVIGMPVSGRPFPGSLDMAGYCTHMVPMRSRLAEGASFAELLSATRTGLLDAFDHQDLPFAELIHLLDIPRTAGSFPLISAVFNLEPVSALPAFDGLAARLAPQVIRFTPFDLFVNVIDGGNVLLVDADFNTDLLEEATARRLLDSYASLLGGMTEDPRADARRLPILGDDERRRVLIDWNQTAVHYPAAAPAHVLFERWAAQAPEAVALRAAGRIVTYGELNARANQLAHYLRGQGVGPGVPVAICCDRSLELIAGIFGVLKAGGAFVPIDPEYPHERIELMVSDSGSPVLLTQDRWSGALGAHVGVVLRLDTEWDAVAWRPDGNPDTPAADDQPAYIIYTSGSTGRPKGTLNTHRGLTNLVLWSQDTYRLTPDDRVLHKTPTSFDLAVWEQVWPLTAGAQLVLVGPGGQRDSAHLVDLMDGERVSVAHFVPSMLGLIIDEPDAAQRCRDLRLVISTGEALPVEVQRRFLSTFGGVELHNTYGPTEAAVEVTAWPCTDVPTGAVVPIGRPIANTQLYILDSLLQPVPIGVPGELFIGGANVGLGYLYQPELTAEKFIPHLFLDQPGARLYRTGDLARYRADGAVEFLGRLDHQVKIRGYRVELGEIEAVLHQCRGVRLAVVVAQAVGVDDLRLVAYVESDETGGAFIGRLSGHLQRKLPDYMVPSGIVALDVLPRLPNGKVDRSRLPPLASADAYVPPATPVEAAIAGVWQDVLNLDRVGVDDDFFALGGNSLSATQVVARINRHVLDHGNDARGLDGPSGGGGRPADSSARQIRVDGRIGIKDMFTCPTVRGLAARLERGDAPDFGAITPIAPQPHYELSRAERRFWVQDQLADRTRGNSHPVSFLLEGPLDAAALQQAFLTIVDRHEILRTVFIEVDGQPRQKVLALDAHGFSVTTSDLTDGPDSDVALRALERRLSDEPMPLDRGPLFRVHLARLGPSRHACICALHHIVTDGWSIGVLLDEVVRLYDASISGGASPLQAPAIQYKDYAAWHNRLIGSGGAQAMRAYWQAKLAGVRRLALATDRPRAAAGPYERVERRFVVPAEAVATLHAAAQAAGGTLFMGLLTCLKALLFRYTAQEDIAVGTPVAGRVLPELETQIGPYLNILTLRDTITGDDTFATALAEVRQTTLDAYTHQVYPFDRVVEDLRVPRDPSRNPLFDVGFTLQNQDEVQTQPVSRYLRISEIVREDERFDDAEAITDLWFVARAGAGGLEVRLVYNGALFAAPTIDVLIQDLRHLVATAPAQPDTPFHAIPLAGGRRRPLTPKISIALATR